MYDFLESEINLMEYANIREQDHVHGVYIGAASLGTSNKSRSHCFLSYSFMTFWGFTIISFTCVVILSMRTFELAFL